MARPAGAGGARSGGALVLRRAQGTGRRLRRRTARARPRAGRSRRHLVAQQRRMGGHPVRDRQGRADHGQHQSGLPARRAGIRAQQGRLPRADPGDAVQEQRLSRDAAHACARAAVEPSGRAALGAPCEPRDRRSDRRRRARHDRLRRGRARRRARHRRAGSRSWRRSSSSTIRSTSSSRAARPARRRGRRSPTTTSSTTATSSARRSGSTERDEVCIPVPLYHCFGMVLGNLACVTHGAAMVYPGAGLRPPEPVLETVAEERCTALYGVPTMFIAELEPSEVQALRPVVACAPGSWPAARARSRSCAASWPRCTCAR